MLEEYEYKKTMGVYEVVSNLKSIKNISVKFVKKSDGKDRVMNCTLNFDKIPKEHYPKGISKTAEVEPVELKEYLRVYDVEKKGWRSIPLFKLDWINVDGEEYLIEYDEAG